MRMGNMGYMLSNLVFIKGQKVPLSPVKIQIPPIFMKFKPYILEAK